MKRGTIHHHKTVKLATALGIERWGAVGILESLWHATAERTPQGDIGKLSDEEISYYVGWLGDPAALVNALLGCGWLERSDNYRLLVHDWHDHADDATKKRLARNGIGFVTGHVQSCPDNGGQRRTCPEPSRTNPPALALPPSMPLPLPSPSMPPKGGEIQTPMDGMDGRREALASANIGGSWADIILASPCTRSEIESETKRVRASKNVANVAAVVAAAIAKRHGIVLPNKRKTGPKVIGADEFTESVRIGRQNRGLPA